jgi:nitrogen fixation protein FixH
MATVILATAAISVNLLLMHKLAESWPTLTPAQQYDAAMQAFAWITGQASAALGYWFVARGSSK